MTAENVTATPAIRMDIATILMKRRVITFTSVAIALLLWEVFGRQVNPLFGSYPSDIAAEMVELTLSRRLPSAFFQSLQPFVIGFGIAAILGIPLGMLLGRFRFMEAAFRIYVTAGNAMPLIAITPLFMLWFGLGFTVKVAIIATLSFFPICMSTWSGG